MTEPESEKPVTVDDLLTELIPLTQKLSSDLFNHVSTNFHGGVVIRDLASDIASASAVLTTFRESTSKYPIADTVENVPILLRSLKLEVEKVAKVLENALSKEDDQDWLDDGEGKPRTFGDPRQVAIQEGIRDIGPMGTVMGSIEDAQDALAFLGVMAKLNVLMAIEEADRTDEQKREIKRALEQYDFNMVIRQKNSIRNITRTAIYRERAAKEKEHPRMGDDESIVSYGERIRVDPEFDARSIVSFDSFASDQFVESKEVYEYWVLQKMEGESRVRSTWKFFGLTAKEMMDDTSYTLEGKPRPQAEMKAKDEETRTEEEYHAREASIQATISTLSYRFQNELLLLLQDRERATSNVRFLREWSIVDIQLIKPKFTTQAKSWSAWWKGSGGINQWGVIIKGETTFKQEAGSTYSANIRVPDRFQDAFKKTTYPPIIDRDYDRRRFPEDERVVPRIPVRQRANVHRSRVQRKEPTQEMYKKEVEALFNDLDKSKDEHELKVEDF